MQIESLAADDAFNGDNNADDVDDAHMSGSDDAGGDDIAEKMDDSSATLEKDQPVIRQFVPILQSRPCSLSRLYKLSKRTCNISCFYSESLLCA